MKIIIDTNLWISFLIGKKLSAVRDAKDLYLLSLADTVYADCIITGDKDLLSLHCHNQTQIMTYSGFVSCFFPT
jgi:predicted nucleic acid-binding protein